MAGDGGLTVDDDEKRQITDKEITDALLANHKFYCDRSDENLPLYLWVGDRWSNGAAEGAVLENLTDIFANEDDRRKMTLQHTIEFLKGSSMRVKVVPKPPEFIAFLNGILNVKTLELMPHSPEYFYVHVIPVNWNPTAECPKWIEFLREVTIDQTDRDFLQEWAGYELYEAYPEVGFLIILGPGQNGKSIYMEVKSRVLGEDNITAIDLATITYSEYGRAQLYRKLAVLSDDIGSTEIKNAGPLREMSAGARISGRYIYGKNFDFKSYAKPTFTANEPPIIHDKSDAMKFRLKAIEFPYTFVKAPDMAKGERAARDSSEYITELMAEREGIILWAVMGLKRLMDNRFKFSVSRSVEETWKFYERKSNPITAFVEERILFDDAIDTKPSEMYAYFTAWLADSSLKMKVSRDKFYKGMAEHGIKAEQSRAHDQKRYYLGVGVKCNAVTPFNTPPVPQHQKTLDSREEGSTKPSYTVTEPQPPVTPSRQPEVIDLSTKARHCEKCNEPAKEVKNV